MRVEVEVLRVRGCDCRYESGSGVEVEGLRVRGCGLRVGGKD